MCILGKFFHSTLTLSISILAMSFFAVISHADSEEIKIAFLADDAIEASNAAIYCGARDAVRDLKLKYNRNIEISMADAHGNAPEQKRKLGSLGINGFSGAIVRPINAEDLSREIKRLSAIEFYTTTVENPAGGISSVATDSGKFIKAIKSEIKRAGGDNCKTICFFKSPNANTYDLDFTNLDRQYTKTFSENQLKEIFSSRAPMKTEAINFYSEYAEKNAVEIDRYDDYGIVFFSPDIISDIRPFPRDSDRIYSICVGALPQFYVYLKDKTLNACIYDDFYGWGYVATRDLLQKICEPKISISKTKLLPPLIAKPDTAEEFSKEWTKWLK